MKVNYVTCPHCGVVIDFDRCTKLWGVNLEWCHNDIRFTCCPVCKFEVPEESNYHKVLGIFKLKED